MTRTVIRARLALVASVVSGAALAVPAALAAQSVPGAIAKQAANNAVAATNRHTEAMTNTSAATTIPGQDAPARPSARSARQAATASAAAANAATASTAGTASTKSGAKPAPAQTATSTATAATPAAAKTPATAAQTAAAAPAGPAPRYAATSGKGQGTASVSVTESGATTQLGFARETFEYAGRGRRDPFVSLMASGDLRPIYQDLSLVAVLYDPTGRNSVAIMRDISTKDQYRVKVGQTLGRMRVSQIQPKQVVFALEEFGYSRQEVLALNDSTHARKK
jgi:hypothetical protein